MNEDSHSNEYKLHKLAEKFRLEREAEETARTQVNISDTQLKQALAKMVKGVYLYHGELFWYATEVQAHAPVLDTELLHLCGLVEERLSAIGYNAYCNHLDKQLDNSNRQSATWQQRVVALCKVKEIEIV